MELFTSPKHSSPITARQLSDRRPPLQLQQPIVPAIGLFHFSLRKYILLSVITESFTFNVLLFC